MQKLRIVHPRISEGRYRTGDIVYRRSSSEGDVVATHTAGEDHMEWNEACDIPGSFALFRSEFEAVVEAEGPNLGLGTITVQADELLCLLYPQAFSKEKLGSVRNALRTQLAAVLGNA